MNCTHLKTAAAYPGHPAGWSQGVERVRVETKTGAVFYRMRQTCPNCNARVL